MRQTMLEMRGCPSYQAAIWRLGGYSSPAPNHEQAEIIIITNDLEIGTPRQSDPITGE